MFFIVLILSMTAGCKERDIPLNQDVQVDKTETPNEGTKSKKEIPYQFMIDGKLYVDTGETESSLKCGVMDLELSKVIPRNQVPVKDGEANFISALQGVQYGKRENRMVARLDDGWHIFAYNENNLDGVSLNVIEASSEKLKISFENKLRKEFLFGEWFLIERYDENTKEWTPIEETSEVNAFHDIGYILKAAGSSEQEIDFAWRYGKLAPGTYRIVKDVIDSNHSAGYDKYWLTTEFTIK